MPVPNALFGAVDALRQKIVAASATASCEDLAYLASAIEKIAGHVTLLELSEHVDALKQVLDTYISSAKTDFTDALSTQSQNSQQEITSLKNICVKELQKQQMDSQAAVTETSVIAAKTMDDKSATLLQSVNESLAQLAIAIEMAKNTAATVSNSQPYGDADLAFLLAQ